MACMACCMYLRRAHAPRVNSLCRTIAAMKTPPLVPEAGEMLRLCELVYEDIPALASSSTRVTGDCVYTDAVDISDARWDVDAFMANRRSSNKPEPDSSQHARVEFGAKKKPTIAPAAAAADIVVAVRGTESWADIKADLKVCKSGKADTSCLTRVHCGFLSCAFALLEPVYARITELQQKQRDVTVWITGHSLGGAVATLLAYMLCHLKELPEGVALRVCTFGSPRVGNWWFREAYNAMDAITTYRFCTDRDIITCMPCFNYWHVGQRIVLDTAPKLTPEAAGCGRFVTRLRLPVCFSAHKLVSYRAALERQQQRT